MNQGHLTIELSEEQSDALREWAEQLSWDSGMERPAHISVSFTTSPSGKIVLKFTVDIQLLVEQLHALDQGVRENAIDRLQYLRDFCDTPITDEVAPLLDDTKPYTRAAAISALNDSSTRAEAEVLEKVIGLLGDDEERVKEEAIEFVESQMGSIGATALWRVLLMLRSEKTSGCAQRILDESGDRVSDGVASEIADLAVREDEEMQQIVVRYLSSIGHEDLISFYLPWLVTP